MTIHRPNVGEAHIFKQGGVQEAVFHPVFHPVGGPIEELSSGNPVGHRPVNPLDAKIARARAKLGQVMGHTAHVLRNGHLIVVQNDDQKARDWPRRRSAPHRPGRRWSPVPNQRQDTECSLCKVRARAMPRATDTELEA